MKKGITLIELLLVVAIIAVIGASISPFLSRFVLQTNSDSTSDKVIGSIRKAQSNTMNGKDGDVWGVCMTGNIIRLYSGSCATPTISEDFTVPTSVSVVGLSDTTFNDRGEPSASMSVTISSDVQNISVNLNSAGGMEIN